MRLILRSLLLLWLFFAISTLLLLSIQQQAICGATIHIENNRRGIIHERLLDFRTGVQFDYPAFRGFTGSPSREMYYTVSDLVSANYEFTLISTDDNSSRTLFTFPDQIYGFWSADSQSLFIYQETGRNPARLLHFDIETGDILAEYSNLESVPYYSPDRQYLYFAMPSDTGNNQMVALDTLTGEISNFGFSSLLSVHSWSPDGRWMTLFADRELYIVDAATGEFHPEVGVMKGYTVFWTDDNLWIERWHEDATGVFLSRASLADGSITQEYGRGGAVAISNDSRWRYVGLEEDDDVNFYLHDARTDVYHPDLNFLKPQFSDNSRCVVALHYNPRNASQRELIVYDLAQLETVYVNSLDGIRDVDDYLFRWQEN